MLSEQDIELAHPDAFDFVFGNLPSGNAVWFNRHLDGCSHCQKVVGEYSGIGRIFQDLPPHVEPPAGLEDRTVAAMVTAVAEQRAQGDHRSENEDQTATRVYPKPEPGPPAGLGHPAEPETRLYPRPQFHPPVEPQARPEVPPEVTRLPVWQRPRRLAAAAALAAAIIIAAAIVIPRIGHGGTPAQAVFVIPLHATTAAAKVIGDKDASGQATARQAGQSWTVDLSVRGLKPLPAGQFYECWYAGPGSTQLHPILTASGTFVVGNSGQTTVTMTSAADPRHFRTMEITAESPGDGALHGAVLLIGQATL
jgi:Anti-sigma-K factor rskA